MIDKDKLGKEIITLLYQNNMILSWYKDNPKGYLLASGNWSPFYISLRKLTAFPQILKKIGQAIYQLIKTEIIQKTKYNNYTIVGLAMAGIPIAIATSIEGNIPAAFTRKIEGNKIQNYNEIIQQYGKHSLVEGRFEPNDNIILIDDLVSFFTSKQQAIKLIQFEAKKRNTKKPKINNIVVLIDREQGGKQEAKKQNIKLISLIPFKNKGIEWLKPSLNPQEYNVIKDYLENPNTYQNTQKQNEISKISPLYKK